MTACWTPCARSFAQVFFEIDPEKAITAIGRILEIEPTVAAWIGLAQWQLSNGRGAEALMNLESAITLDPDSGAAHFVHAQTLRELGYLEEADAAELRSRELACQIWAPEEVLGDEAGE